MCESCALDFSDCSEANKEARPLLLHINITLLVARRSTNIKWKYIGRDYSQYRWIGRILAIRSVYGPTLLSSTILSCSPTERSTEEGRPIASGFLCVCARSLLIYKYTVTDRKGAKKRYGE